MSTSTGLLFVGTIRPRLLRYLDEDVDSLNRARQMLKAVEATSLGSTVELDDVERFVPLAWKWDSDDAGPGGWLYAPSDVREAEDDRPDLVVRIREYGGDF